MWAFRLDATMADWMAHTTAEKTVGAKDVATAVLLAVPTVCSMVVSLFIIMVVHGGAGLLVAGAM